jgi:MFS family permease
VSHADFTTIDEQKFKAFHWRATLTTGLGVFCDGYDLSSVALVLPMILKSFGHSNDPGLQGTLSAMALAGAAIGALVFGVLGQKGRRTFYGLDVLILGIAAAAQAFAPNILWLIGIRLVLGFGVGGDYVLSPMIMAEHSNRADRGRALGLGFGTMWPVGALAAVLLKFLLQFLHVDDDLQWRLVLAGGAVPALAVLYFRRTMPETARFLARMGGQQGEAAKVMEQISGVAVEGPPSSDERGFWEVFRLHAREILAAALLWMMYDLVVYVFILFGPNLIAKSINMDPATFAFLTQVLFVLPASVIGSLFIIDQVGRKPLQGWGFLGGAVLLGVFALMQNQLLAMPAVAFAVYGALNVAMTGPGLVSGAGILGVELAPTRVRSVAQSITVAGGRIGAAISGFAFPLLFAGIGQAGAYWVVVGLAVLGAVFTWLLVPETGRISLEAITEAPAAQKA